MPNLVAYDLAGVQPMNGPTGLIFAMRSRYTSVRVELKHSSMSQIPDSLHREKVMMPTQGPYTTGSDADAVGFGTASQVGTNPACI